MALATEQKTWLDKTGEIAGARIDWQHNESVKSDRLEEAHKSVVRLKETLRALSEFEVEVKRAGKLSTLRQAFAGNKTVKSMKGTEKGWKVLDEFDFGHYEDRIATDDGKLPPEIQRRVDAAMEMIEELQNTLQHGAIDPSEHDGVRNELSNKLNDTTSVDNQMKSEEVKERIEKELKIRIAELEAQKKSPDSAEVRKEIEASIRAELTEGHQKKVLAKMAREKNCTVQDIQEVQLAGAVPRDQWNGIRSEIGEQDDEIKQARRDFEVRSERLKDNGDSMPTKIREQMAKDLKTEKSRIEALQTERDDAVRKLAKKHKTTVDVINDIVGIKPVFDDLEIRRDLWDPLVREGVIPASMVPDDYSEIVQQFMGADQLYRDRTESEYEKDPRRDTKERLAFAKEMTGNIMGIVTAGFGGAGAIGKGTKNAKLEQIGQIGEYVSKGVKAFSDNIFTGVSKVVEKEYSGLWEVAGSTIGGIIASSMPGKDNAALGKAISVSIQAGGKAAGSLHKHILGPLAKGEKPKWKDAAQVFADVVASAFTVASSAGKHRGEKDEQWAKICTEIAKYAPAAFAGVFVGVEVAEGAKKGEFDFKALGSAIEKAAQKTVATGLKHALDQMEERSTGVGTTSFTDKSLDHLGREKGSTALGGAKSGVDAAIGTGIFDKLKDFIPDSKAMEEAMETMEKEATDKELIMEADEFRREMILGFGYDVNDPEAMKLASDSAAIDKLISKIERDRALIQMAEAIFDTGFKTAGELFEPLKVVSGGKDMVKQMIIAGQRAVEFHRWRQLNRKALVACSSQGFAFANRVMNLKVQITDHTLDSLCELAKVIGGIGAAAGMAGFGVGSQAGKVLTKGAEMAQSLKNLVLQFYKKNELRKAWNEYKDAIANPQDRILKYKVLKSNPTLSKYAMAYAAIFEDDVIARQGLKVCGLSEESLKHQDTDAHKVVAYLETKFDEDPILIKKLTPKSWQPKIGNELSMKGWNDNRDAAVKSKDLKLDAGSLGRTEGTLLKFFARQKAHEEAVESISVEFQRYEIAAADYLPAMEAYDDGRDRVRDSRHDLEVQDQVISSIEFDTNTNEKASDGPDQKAVKQLLNSCAQIEAALKMAGNRATDMRTAIDRDEKRFETFRSMYAPVAKGYETALQGVAAQHEFIKAASALRESLRSGNPADTGGETSQPFVEYMEALAIRSHMAENEAKVQVTRNEERITQLGKDIERSEKKIDFKKDKESAQKLTDAVNKSTTTLNDVRVRLVKLATPETKPKKSNE